MESIIREPTKSEMKDFKPLDKGSGYVKEPLSRLMAEISKYQLEATKKGLPFADRVAIDEFQDELNRQSKLLLRKDGFVNPNKLKLPTINWNKYSDLKNFNKIDEGEIHDQHLSDRNPGLRVMIKFTKYQFKGYSNIYVMMEDGDLAIQRAQNKRRDFDTPIKVN